MKRNNSIYIAIILVLAAIFTSCGFDGLGKASASMQIVLPANPSAQKNSSRSVKLQDVSLYVLTITSLENQPVFIDGTESSEIRKFEAAEEAQKIKFEKLIPGPYEITLELYESQKLLISSITKEVILRPGVTEQVKLQITLKGIEQLEFNSEEPGSKENPVRSFSQLKQIAEGITSQNYATVIYVDDLFETEKEAVTGEGIVIQSNVVIKSVDKNKPAEIKFRPTSLGNSLFRVKNMNDTQVELTLQNLILSGACDEKMDEFSADALIYAGLDAKVNLEDVTIKDCIFNSGFSLAVVLNLYHAEADLKNVRIKNCRDLYSGSLNGGFIVLSDSNCYVENLIFEDCESAETEGQFITVSSGNLYLGGKLCIPKGIYLGCGVNKIMEGHVLRNSKIELVDAQGLPAVESERIQLIYSTFAPYFLTKDSEAYHVFTNSLGEVWDKHPEVGPAELFEPSLPHDDSNLSGKRKIHMLQNGKLVVIIASNTALKQLGGDIAEGGEKILYTSEDLEWEHSTVAERVTLSGQKKLTIKSLNGGMATISGVYFILEDQFQLNLRNIYFEKIVEGMYEDTNPIITVNSGSTFKATNSELTKNKGPAIKIDDETDWNKKFTAIDLQNVTITECNTSDSIIWARGYSQDYCELKADGLKIIPVEGTTPTAIYLKGGNTLYLNGLLQIPDITLEINQEYREETGINNTAYLARTGEITIPEGSSKIQLKYSGNVNDNWNVFTISYENPAQKYDLYDKADVNQIFEIYNEELSVEEDGRVVRGY